MHPPTIIEGIVLVLGLLVLSPLYAWFWRERREPEPEPLPARPARKSRCVWTQRAGHVFVVVYYDHQLSEAIDALFRIALISRTPMNSIDAERLADAMEARRA